MTVSDDDVISLLRRLPPDNWERLFLATQLSHHLSNFGEAVSAFDDALLLAEASQSDSERTSVVSSSVFRCLADILLSNLSGTSETEVAGNAVKDMESLFYIHRFAACQRAAAAMIRVYGAGGLWMSALKLFLETVQSIQNDINDSSSFKSRAYSQSHLEHTNTSSTNYICVFQAALAVALDMKHNAGSDDTQCRMFFVTTVLKAWRETFRTESKFRETTTSKSWISKFPGMSPRSAAAITRMEWFVAGFRVKGPLVTEQNPQTQGHDESKFCTVNYSNSTNTVTTSKLKPSTVVITLNLEQQLFPGDSSGDVSMGEEKKKKSPTSQSHEEAVQKSPASQSHEEAVQKLKKSPASQSHEEAVQKLKKSPASQSHEEAVQKLKKSPASQSHEEAVQKLMRILYVDKRHRTVT